MCNFLCVGEDGIRHLLTRGSFRAFSYSSLSVMLAWYFLGAAWASGSAISSGLFVPMLFIGACMGRLVGLWTLDLADHYRVAKGGLERLGLGNSTAVGDDPWAWVDPGAFALVGAGAFMGGVTRLTISLSVIMMEISNDVRMLLPILVAIIFAKWTGDALTHALYHALLEVKCVPFLPNEAQSNKCNLDLVEVKRVMALPVVTLKVRGCWMSEIY